MGKEDKLMEGSDTQKHGNLLHKYVKWVKSQKNLQTWNELREEDIFQMASEAKIKFKN